MKLPIESWAEEYRLPGEALEALREAAIAYRAGAYRAALLFTYISWGLVLRRRMLSAQCPPGVPGPKWQGIIKALLSEETWDQSVFEATQMQQPAPVFVVSEDLRVQVRYWKDRRNDCAHSKNNAITAAHVEAMWAFMQSNLAKFVPGGSMEDLLSRLRQHFDPNLTPVGSSCDHLASAVASAIPAERRKEFFQEALSFFTRTLGPLTYLVPEAAPFFEAVLRVAPGDVAGALKQFLFEQPSLLAALLSSYPKYAFLLSDQPALVRQLWRVQLVNSGSRTLPVYASVLRHGLIPPEQMAEAHGHLIETCQIGIPGSDDVDALQSAGFFGALREYAFVQQNLNSFKWGNPSAELVAWYVATFPLDPEVARSLCSIFSSEPYPRHAHARLKVLFDTLPSKRDEFCRIVSQHSLAWPEPLLGPPLPPVPASVPGS